MILVGGSCRLRPVQDALRQMYDNKVIVSNYPDECVVYGTLRASSIEEARTGVVSGSRSFLSIMASQFMMITRIAKSSR